nr:hypothetical protein [uncultured Roseovarius sp.]
MATRDTTNSSTTPKPSGLDFLDEYSGHVGALYNNSTLPLTSVSGADTITASVDPALPSGGLVVGMKFTVEWASDNTGAATLNIDSVGAVSIVDRDGGTLLAGKLASGMRDLIEFDGTNFVLITGGADATTNNTGRTVYTSSGVWTNGLPSDAIVLVECWGAGAGGYSGNTVGGGGGAYQRAFFRAGDLPSEVTITVPSGGALSSNGGNCTFGTHLTAHGGNGSNAFATPAPGGGVGPDGDIPSGVFGGGDGASNSSSSPAGKSCWGGGGGGSSGFAAGGASQFGGDGGNYGVAGAAPGGGGGGGAVGGAGRCIVTIF